MPFVRRAHARQIQADAGKAATTNHGSTAYRAYAYEQSLRVLEGLASAVLQEILLLDDVPQSLLSTSGPSHDSCTAASSRSAQ